MIREPRTLEAERSNPILDFCLAQDAERRVSCQALYYWTTLQKDGNLPNPDKVDFNDVPEISNNLFLMATGNGGGKFIIQKCGDLLTETCGENPLGRTLLNAFPEPLNESAVECCFSAVAAKQPMLNFGTIILENNDEIEYRMIMMPLTTDDASVDHLLGALSFKVVE